MKVLNAKTLSFSMKATGPGYFSKEQELADKHNFQEDKSRVRKEL